MDKSKRYVITKFNKGGPKLFSRIKWSNFYNNWVCDNGPTLTRIYKTEEFLSNHTTILLNVGDKVKYINTNDVLLNQKCMYNKIGKIIVVENNYYTIEFDEWFGGHSDGGRGKWGHCWSVDFNSVIYIDDQLTQRNIKKFNFISDDI